MEKTFDKKKIKLKTFRFFLFKSPINGSSFLQIYINSISFLIKSIINGLKYFE